MSKKEIDIERTLRPSRVWFAAGIGLLITAWMFYRSFTEVSYSKEKGATTHAWVDGNKNGKVDKSDPADFILSEGGGYIELGAMDVLSSIKWDGWSYFWLGAALLFTVGRDFFYLLRIRILTKNHLSWKASFYVIMLWEFASALTPGVVGGAAVAMFILNRESIAFGRSTAIVIITAFMDNLFFVVMIPLVLLTVGQAGIVSSNGETSLFLSSWFWIGFLIISGICLFLYLSIFWFPNLAGRVLLFVFRLPFLKRWKFIAKEWGKDIAISAQEFQQETRAYWFKVFLATFGSWMSRYLVINAVLNAFLQLGLVDNFRVLGKQLILWLFMLVSPTPGGSGVAEFAFGELLADFSGSTLLLAALALIWRLISYFPYLLIGSLLLPSWIKRTRGK
jgi:uncharacterized protein (TIRG00374 family)